MEEGRRETPLATIERVDADRVEVRFRSAVRIDIEGIAEIMAVRKALCGEDRVAVLAVIPGDADLDMSVMSLDHYTANDGADHLTTMAVVAGGSMAELMVRLYYAYFPPPFPYRIFHREEEASNWLEQQIAARA